MKDFLFKAKRKDNGEWIEGLPFYGLSAGLKVYAAIIPFAEVPSGDDAGKKYSDIWLRAEVEESTFSRYIGTCDKTGRKIFEGDVVKMTFEEDGEDWSPEYLTVYYDEKLCAFLCRSDCATHPVECDVLYQGEIVGNIHDEK